MGSSCFLWLHKFYMKDLMSSVSQEDDPEHVNPLQSSYLHEPYLQQLTLSTVTTPHSFIERKVPALVISNKKDILSLGPSGCEHTLL